MIATYNIENQDLTFSVGKKRMEMEGEAVPFYSYLYFLFMTLTTCRSVSNGSVTD